MLTHTFNFISILAAAGTDGASGDLGSVSNLVAAILETAGVYAQAEVLKNFSKSLTDLAGLIYLVAIIGAIISVAVFGTYRKGLYLLIGPPLFFFVIETKATYGGTQLKMGSQTRGSVEDRKHMLEKYAQKNPNLSSNSQVSWLFLGIDNFVSSIVQGVVDVLVDTKNKEDLVIASRERVYSWIMRAYPNEPPFIKLISKGYLGYCSNLMAKTSAITNERIDITQNSSSTGNLTATGQKLLNEYNDFKTRRVIKVDGDVIAYLKGLGQIADVKGEYVFSCEQIWGFIRILTVEFAKSELDNLELYFGGAPKDIEVPWDEVKKSIRESFNSPNGKPEDILAAYILKGVLANTSHQSMVSSIFDRRPFNADKADGILNKVADSDSHGAYLRIQYFASAIPYIQGILLYMLAASFPFFALFLVIPNRAMTFVVWISLWVWVKTWDIGFAMVNVARRVMWQFVTTGQNAVADNLDWAKPETVFSLIASNDPLGSLNTYLQISALLTCSVPLLTAHFCLGANNLFGAFKMSIDDAPRRFGGAKASAMRRDLATNAERNIEAKENYAGMWGALNASKQWFTREGKSISDRGDNSLTKAMSTGYRKAMLDYHYSREGLNNFAYLGAVTGRQVTNSYHHVRGGRQYLHAYVSSLQMSLQGTDSGKGGTDWNLVLDPDINSRIDGSAHSLRPSGPAQPQSSD